MERKNSSVAQIPKQTTASETIRAKIVTTKVWPPHLKERPAIP
jgi:hypothetical protein